MAADDLRTRLRAASTAALKARERDVAAAFRSVLGAIDNAEAVAAPEPLPVGDSPVAGAVSGLGAGDVARRALGEEDIVAIVVAELADLRDSADDYDGLGQAERAARLRAGADAIDAVLLAET